MVACVIRIYNTRQAWVGITWVLAEKGTRAVFYSPPEVIPGVFQWDYSSAIKAPRAPPPIAPSVAAAHRTPQDGRPPAWDPAGFASLSLLLSLPSCLAVYKKKAHFFGRFCGVRNARLRRTFCCVVHQKRDFKAHPAASTTLLSSAPFNSPPTLDSRLTTLPLSTSARARLSKLAIRLPLVWKARPRVRLWP